MLRFSEIATAGIGSLSTPRPTEAGGELTPQGQVRAGAADSGR